MKMTDKFTRAVSAEWLGHLLDLNGLERKQLTELLKNVMVTTPLCVFAYFYLVAKISF